MSQTKYIVIGESTLAVDFNADGSIASHLSGTLINTAVELAKREASTLFITELGLDAAGREMARQLTDTGIDISCSDRFNDGRTPLQLTIDGVTTRYDIHPDTEGLDIAWPRIENTDIVIFGGYMALEQRNTARLHALLAHAAERSATIVYIPDVADVRLQRITRVMPQVFENLELANIVIASEADLLTLFNTTDRDKAFSQHVSYYCDRLEVTDSPAVIADKLMNQA